MMIRRWWLRANNVAEVGQKQRPLGWKHSIGEGFVQGERAIDPLLEWGIIELFDHSNKIRGIPLFDISTSLTHMAQNVGHFHLASMVVVDECQWGNIGPVGGMWRMKSMRKQWPRKWANPKGPLAFLCREYPKRKRWKSFAHFLSSSQFHRGHAELRKSTFHVEGIFDIDKNGTYFVGLNNGNKFSEFEFPLKRKTCFYPLHNFPPFCKYIAISMKQFA